MPDERKLSELPEVPGDLAGDALGVVVVSPATSAETMVAPLSKWRAFVLGIAVAGTVALPEATLTLAGNAVVHAGNIGSQALAATQIASGTLAVARGGTGLGSYGAGNYLRAQSAAVLEERTPAQVLADIGAAAAAHVHAAGDITSGTLAVARGGTGLGSYTTGNYLRAASASALEQRTPAQVLADIGAAAASHTHAASDIVSGTLAVARGGTGLASYTAGSFLYASGTTTLAQRTPAQVLADIGAAASAHTHAAGDIISGTIATARLGSGTANGTTFLRGDQTWVSLAMSLATLSDTAISAPSTAHYLRYNGAAWVNVPLQGSDLPSHVHAAGDITSGTLAVARGGTGLGTYTAGNFLRAQTASVLEQRTPAQVLSDIGAAAASHGHAAGDITSGTLPVARGGTGLTLLTAGNYLRAFSASAIEERTPAQVLADIGGAAAAHTHAATDLVSGTVPTARLGSGSASASTFLRGDQTWASIATTLAALTDTAIDTPAVSQYLRFNGAAWVNVAIQAGDLPPHAHAASDVTTGTLAVARGGTGISSYTVGNYLFASGTTTLGTRTPAQVLADIGAAPSSHQHSTGEITSGVFTVARGGTGLGSLTAGSFLRAVSTSGFEQRTPAQVLADIGGAAASHTHSAADIVNGTLAVSYGGTGMNSYTVGNFLYANGVASLGTRTPAQVLADIAAAPIVHTHSAADITAGTLSVARGGTGLNAYTSGNYIRAQTSSVLEQRTPTQVRSDIGAAAAAHTHAAADIISGTVATARLGSGTANGTTFLRGDQTWATVVLALAALSDTAIATPATGHYLRYNGSAWVNVPLQLSDLPSHTHAASDITSGTLAVARGGTGLGSYTTGNYLRAASASVLEQRTPAQVRSDIGAAASSHTHAASDIASGTLASARLSGAYSGITALGTLTGLLVGSPPAGAEPVRIGGDVRIAGTIYCQNWVLI